jgi:hypothetical protein
MNGRDLFLDVRLHPPADATPLRRKCDTVQITCQGGKIGLGNIIDFVAVNRNKFIKVRKGIVEMLKAKHSAHLNEVRSPKAKLVKMG